MGVDRVKESNRLKYQRTDRGQDHGTRGTQRNKDEVRMKAEVGELLHRKQEAALIRDHFQPAKEVQNLPENIEIKRRIRRKVKEMVQESVEQWRSIWGSNPYAIKDSFFPADTVFQNCVKENDTPFFIYSYRGKTIRIRPSELKLYKSLLHKYPAKDKEDKPLNVLSGYGESELIRILTGLSSNNSSGVSPLAMERSYIAKQVREELKKHQGGKQKKDEVVYYEEDDLENDGESYDLLGGIQAVDSSRPLTVDEIEEVRQAKKEKYFGKR